jgi:hypothetical protein
MGSTKFTHHSKIICIDKSVDFACCSHKIGRIKRINKRAQEKRSHIGDRNMYDGQDLAVSLLANSVNSALPSVAVDIAKNSASRKPTRSRTLFRRTAHEKFEIGALAAGVRTSVRNQRKSFEDGRVPASLRM